jgi:hypothetical protein
MIVQKRDVESHTKFHTREWCPSKWTNNKKGCYLKQKVFRPVERETGELSTPPIINRSTGRRRAAVSRSIRSGVAIYPESSSQNHAIVVCLRASRCCQERFAEIPLNPYNQVTAREIVNLFTSALPSVLRQAAARIAIHMAVSEPSSEASKENHGSLRWRKQCDSHRISTQQQNIFQRVLLDLPDTGRAFKICNIMIQFGGLRPGLQETG